MGKDEITQHIPADLLGLYEFYSHRHAAAILATGCKALLDEVLAALRAFRITVEDIQKPGGNESEIPRKVARLLRPNGWLETRIRADLHVYMMAKQTRPLGAKRSRTKGPPTPGPGDEFLTATPVIRPAFIDGHKVDFVKGDVALDFEWNSKDQTFDRDLYALRAFYDCDLISAGIVFTRARELNLVFKALGPELRKDGEPKLTKAGKVKMLATKYGASTTWMGKLTSRIEAGRAGGCPILAIGIRQGAVSDWEQWQLDNPGAVAAVEQPDVIEEADDDADDDTE